MHPPFKGACTKRLVALAKKAAIRVFFFGFAQVCLRSVWNITNVMESQGCEQAFHLSDVLCSEDSFEETTTGQAIHDNISP